MDRALRRTATSPGRPGGAPPIAARPDFAVRGLAGDRLELQLAGALPAHWCRDLTGNLAARGISVWSGYAREHEAGRWLGRFELELATAADRRLDFLALAQGQEPAPRLFEPPILDFQLDRGSAFAGSLELEVHAWEAVGLLASVLAHVDAVDLLPRALHLETEEDCAFHRLVLTDRSGRAPERVQERALLRALALRT